MTEIVLNEKIGLKPYPKMATEAGTPAANGRATSVSTPGGQGTTLIPLEVVFTCSDPLKAANTPLVRVGDIAWVRAEDRAQGWAKPVKRQGIDGDFILAPIRNVEMITRKEG